MTFQDTSGIVMQKVVKTFVSGGKDVTVLNNISLTITPGELVGIVGPSGSGKSTLLNMITGIDRPTSGQVYVQGQCLNRLSENQMARWRGKNVGIVFQFFQLLPTLSVLENVILPMDFCHLGKRAERKNRALSCLELVGIAEHAHKLPSALSGGQQQRVAIARALVNDPSILIADEPTGNLDSQSATQIFSLLEELCAQGKTILTATHNPELAARTPRLVHILDGEIQTQVGSQPEEDR